MAEQLLPKPQAPNLAEFFDIKNSHPLLRYTRNVRLKFMHLDNFGLSLADAGELQKNKAIPLKDLFVFPHLAKNHLDPEQVIRAELENTTQPDWQSIYDVLKQHPHCFILGDPGTGKTTLIHWLMFAFANVGENLTKLALGELVPFALILRELPLRGVNNFEDLWQVFTQQNDDLMQAFDGEEAVVKALLHSGQAIILLDGLDEITHQETRQRLGQAVLEGMHRYPACRFVISSRIVGFDQLQWFGLATQAPNEDLENQFMRDKAELLPVHYLVPFAYQQAQQFVSNWYQQYQPNHDGNHQQRVAELISRMKKNDGLGRLSRIPVLLNMICFIHARRGRLPDGRAELYQRIAETYLVSLDTARGISTLSRFDYADRSQWLAAIALTMQHSRSENETAILISEAKVRAILQDKLSELDVDKDAIAEETSFLLRDFAERSGLFIQRANGLYGFSHLSFLEYFAAKALKLQAELGEIKWRSLKTKTQCIWWHETFVLFFEQLDHAKLAGKYLNQLFPEFAHKREETSENDINAPLLLASIVMDSGVKLTPSQRETYIKRLWAFYLQIPAFFSIRHLSCKTLVNRLWQQDFAAIERGLEVMQQQTEVCLAGADLTDLSALSGLTQLQYLHLNDTAVSDVTALSGLKQLQHLDLSDTAVSDVSALSGLTQLQGLYLYNTAVSDVSALSGLTQLQWLILRNTVVSDVSALSGLTQLLGLYLSNTEVSDVSALSGLTQLQGLDLRNTNASDISTLSGLAQLKFLDLVDTAVRDVSALSGLTQLNSLYLSNTAVSDVSALSGLTQLRELNLNNTAVSDVSVLSGLAQLQRLYLSDTPINESSVSVLSKKLKQLKIIR